MNLGKNGGVRLPPGFRFHPTDEELVEQYLKRKVFNRPLPASIIPDFDVCRSDPWDLPPPFSPSGEKGQERYFFSTREAKYPNGNRSNRATLSGYWKATGKDKPVVARSCNNSIVQAQMIVGMKKTLVFYKGKPPHGCRTDWIMHEYRLVQSHPISPQLKHLPQKTGVATGDWVLCRIFLKKRNNAANKNDQDEEQQVLCDDQEDNFRVGNIDGVGVNGRPIFYDFMSRDRKPTDLNLLPVPCSSSSGSSALTEISSSNDDNNNNNNNNNESSSSEEREESSSCCNSVSSFSLRRKL